MAKNKYYVVWQGHSPGVYDNWEECKKQVEAFPEAKYKGFPDKEEAETAFRKSYREYIQPGGKKNIPKPALINKDIVWDSISVDAACSGNPGLMEYRGVYTKTNKEIFRIGPYKDGTNNIGEFLAIVHALALQKKNNSDLPIYSDSQNALLWVKNKKCKTKLSETTNNKPIFEMIARAEKWLQENTYTTRLMKWQTKEWGEIPADFGRK
ncbi:MAG: ribonuclease H family protein [Candidatus Azobacteroides sp.]|nr:ribonuclease H family protein [Candidatus Azobacteroides sp.]